MITIADVEAYLNGQASTKKFAASALSATAQAQVVAAGEQPVQASLREDYHRMQTRAEGVVLTRDAAEGECDFIIPVCLRAIVAAKSFVWVNLSTAYGDRSKSDAVPFTVVETDDENDTIRLTTPLDENDTAVCDITHTNANPPEFLKMLAVKLAACDVVLYRLPTLIPPQEKPEWIELQRQLQDTLKGLARGTVQVDEYRTIEQIDEMETITPSGRGEIDPRYW